AGKLALGPRAPLETPHEFDWCGYIEHSTTTNQDLLAMIQDTQRRLKEARAEADSYGAIEERSQSVPSVESRERRFAGRFIWIPTLALVAITLKLAKTTAALFAL